MSMVPGVGRAVTPSDTVPLIEPAQLYCGVSGDIQVTYENGGDPVVVLKAHPVGYVIGRFKKVWATNTTATHLIAISG